MLFEEDRSPEAIEILDDLHSRKKTALSRQESRISLRGD